MKRQAMRIKCPAIAQVERDTIGAKDARFGRVARSLGLEVCGWTTLDSFFNRKFSELRARLYGAVPNRVENSPRDGGPVTHREDINQKETTQ